MVEHYQGKCYTAIQGEYDTSFRYKLVVTATGEEACRTRVWVPVDQGRAPDLIPHLTGYHNEYNGDREDGPVDWVVEGVQLFPHPVAAYHHQNEEKSDSE